MHIGISKQGIGYKRNTKGNAMGGRVVLAHLPSDLTNVIFVDKYGLKESVMA